MQKVPVTVLTFDQSNLLILFPTLYEGYSIGGRFVPKQVDRSLSWSSPFLRISGLFHEQRLPIHR